MCQDITYDLDLAYYDQVVFLVNDVHYYLAELRTNVSSDKVTFEVSGIQFYPLPGQYNLPNREGYFTLDDKSNIIMNCRSSGRVYTHPNVYL